MAIMKSEQILAELHRILRECGQNAVSRFFQTVPGLASPRPAPHTWSTTVKERQDVTYASTANDLRDRSPAQGPKRASKPRRGPVSGPSIRLSRPA